MSTSELLDCLAVFAVCGLSIALLIGMFWFFLIIIEWIEDKNY